MFSKLIFIFSIIISFSIVHAYEVPDSLMTQLQPLPNIMESDSNSITDEKVKLGRLLFFDKRFSKNHDISCNSCHGLDTFGVDNKQFSLGHKGQLGGRNAPTVYNAALHLAQFWDGRAKDVEEQAKGPVLNPVEMAMPNEAKVLEVINSITEYQKLFAAAFPGKNSVSYDNFGKAIGAFERKLVTPSKFDAFVNGKKDALTSTEKKGLVKFIETGCISCHNGPAMGGNMYMKIGLVKSWPNLKDQGRYDLTKKDIDKHVFKVPSLRNIEKTGPYLHDGTIKSLDKVVSMMAEHQLGRKLSSEDTGLIVTFLKTLTGKADSKLIAEPTLPESSVTTPKADPK
jgi:cytochrome c peroxidase